MFGVGHVGRGAAVGIASGGGGLPAATLDSSFMGPSLPGGWVFVRPSGNAIWFDSAGVLQVAGAGIPRFDYDIQTLQAKGMWVEESRQQALLWSFNPANAVWTMAGITAAAPTFTQVAGVDGTSTAARLVIPAVSGVGDRSVMTSNFTATAAVWAISVWMKGNVGGETPYISITPDGVTFQRLQVTLTTNWQRFWFATTALTAAAWAFQVGTDRRDASQAASSAMTIFTWAPQAEAGATPGSLIASGASATTRLVESCSIPHTIPGYPVTYAFEGMIPYTNANVAGMFVADDGTVPNRYSLREPAASLALNGAVVNANAASGDISLGNMTPGTVFKAALRYGATDVRYCLNGGTVVNAAGTLPPTFSGITTLRVGAAAVGTQIGNCYVRRVRYWNTGLTDLQLQTVST